MIRLKVGEGEKVLLWGAESAVNFFAGRKCPSRFVYQYPLYTSGYANEGVILEFLDGIIRERPRLIIDTRNRRTPIYSFPVQSDAIREKVGYLQAHYRPVGETGEGWVVYEYMGEQGGL
jgi:hypothetical protein